MFSNNTPYAAQDFPFVDPEGREVVIAVVKASFRIDASGEPRLDAKQAPVRPVDVPWEPDNPNSSVKLPGDVCDAKIGTDLVVVGDAISDKPVASLDVAVSAGDRTLPLRVHGPRLFARGLTGVGIGPAVPFERMPLRYELAYGGASEDLSEVELSNPSGRGVTKQSGALDGKPAPQIEHVDFPHASAADHHPPMGFGAIATHWSPRREFFGTIDQYWVEMRCPLLPMDFNRRFYSVAHPMLWFEQPLLTGTPVAVVGMSEDRVLSFRLPAVPVRISAKFDSGRADVIPMVDTVVVLPNERRVELTLRAAFPLGRQNLLREIHVDPIRAG